MTYITYNYQLLDLLFTYSYLIGLLPYLLDTLLVTIDLD